jgi:hypothetical protein
MILLGPSLRYNFVISRGALPDETGRSYRRPGMGEEWLVTVQRLRVSAKSDRSKGRGSGSVDA